MTAVMATRARHKETFKERYGVGLGLTSFFVKAAIGALRAFPRVNAEIQGDEVVLKQYYDIGIAVGAEGGLAWRGGRRTRLASKARSITVRSPASWPIAASSHSPRRTFTSGRTPFGRCSGRPTRWGRRSSRSWCRSTSKSAIG
jgi:hypothetical protein